jgi:cysteinyl-tRNA synthetase
VSFLLKLFNTQSKSKETFSPQKDNNVSLYTCGPTIYNYAHIGNFRTYVFEDLLRRTLKFVGFDVEQVMNLTDVDDKTIKGALDNNVSLDSYTETFKKAFFEDLQALKIEPAEHYPAATDYVSQMIDMIQQLIDKEFAYQAQDKSIYYSIKKFSSYGSLSHFCIKDLKTNASSRTDNDEYDKENAGDFVLWKAWDPQRDGDIFWESPFGRGRPGWHIECSAMAHSILGETIDIHVGGVDNMFPHHENEIAQSEACFEKQFVKFWLHAEHLIVNNKKMSKSAGNFYTLRDLLEKGFEGNEVRLLLLQTHYRTQLNFTLEGLNAAKSSLTRMQDFIYRLNHYSSPNQNNNDNFSSIIKESEETFTKSLCDDLNISQALAAVFDFIRDSNTLLDQNKLSSQDTTKALEWLKKSNRILDVLNFNKEEDSLSKELSNLLQQRENARKEKNWSKADELRDSILSHGYLIEDGPQGARLKKINKG